MSRNSFVLFSTTAIAAALIATPAAAQDQPVVPPNPDATAQTSPAQPPQAADAPADQNAIEGLVGEEAAAAFTGQKPVRQALIDAEQRVNELLAQVD